jgi:ABC-type glycerol-3-phosphate transport system substrate-binding protein
MEAASLKGLLRSYAGQTTALDDPDWYDYARDLSSVQGSPFGLPFAGDALVLVYRPGVVPEPPPSWRDTLKLAQPLVFSAADPQALFTLLQYQAQGGKVRDEQGRPILDQPRLEQVLDFYREAETNGVMPYWLTQFQTDQQAWDAFNENRADMIVTWSSRHLANMLADTNLASVPTPEGDPYTMATGWVWAMASRQEGHQEQVVRLAEFLTESSFLARWTEAAGYLPPRPSALRAWSNASLKDTLTTIVNSSHLYPPAEFLTALGPPLEQAAVQVLKQQSDPASAAQTAVQSLPAP